MGQEQRRLSSPEAVARDPAEVERRVKEEILQALKGLRYGSVEVTVHDSAIVQIERKEKFRVNDR